MLFEMKYQEVPRHNTITPIIIIIIFERHITYNTKQQGFEKRNERKNKM